MRIENFDISICGNKMEILTKEHPEEIKKHILKLLEQHGSILYDSSIIEVRLRPWFDKICGVKDAFTIKLYHGLCEVNLYLILDYIGFRIAHIYRSSEPILEVDALKIEEEIQIKYGLF